METKRESEDQKPDGKTREAYRKEDNKQHEEGKGVTDAIEKIDSKDHEWQHKSGTVYLNLTNDDDVDGKTRG